MFIGDTSPVGSLSGRKGHISANLVKQDESRSSDEANGDDEEDLKQRFLIFRYLMNAENRAVL